MVFFGDFYIESALCDSKAPKKNTLTGWIEGMHSRVAYVKMKG